MRTIRAEQPGAFERGVYEVEGCGIPLYRVLLLFKQAASFL